MQNTQSGHARLTFDQRRQALNVVGVYSHVEMLRNETKGNAIIEIMSYSYLDGSGRSGFSHVVNTITYVLRHGLGPENRTGHNDWDLRAHDPQTGWVNARELLIHRRASRTMKELGQQEEQYVAFVLYCVAKMVDERA